MALESYVNLGKKTNADYSMEKLNMTRWAAFKRMLSKRLLKVILVNLLMLLFLLPALAWGIYSLYQGVLDSMAMGHTGNLGFSYPVVTDAYIVAAEMNMRSALLSYGVMIPLLMFGGAGLAGGFNAIKHLIFSDVNVKVFGTFFRGMKISTASYIFGMLSIGLGAFVMGVTWASFDYTVFSFAGKFFSGTGAVLFLALAIVFAMYCFAQGSAYRQNPFIKLRNSLLLIFANPILNLFFGAIAAVAFILLVVLPINIAWLALFYLVVFGISFTVALCILYPNFVFYRVSKLSAAFEKSAAADRNVVNQNAANKPKAKPEVRYVNPKKKKTSNQNTAPEESQYSSKSKAFSVEITNDGGKNAAPEKEESALDKPENKE